jgi:hypothetical protein
MKKNIRLSYEFSESKISILKNIVQSMMSDDYPEFVKESRHEVDASPSSPLLRIKVYVKNEAVYDNQ